MATTKAFIRTTQKDKQVNIRFRYSDGRNIQLFHTSEIIILQSAFDEKGEKVKAKVIFDDKKRREIDTAITTRKNLINKLCGEVKDKNLLSTEWLETEIDKALHPEKYEKPPQTFFELYTAFLASKKVAPSTMEKRKILDVALQRFEQYRKSKLEIDTLTAADLTKLESFLRNENSHNPEQPNRSTNTLAVMFKILRSFILWCVKNDYTNNDPFKNYKAPTEKYGTPYYLTIAERNALYNFDLTNRPELERQRDIFIFQCVIGCRAGDLLKLTKANIINNAVEYYAEKTKDKEPEKIVVPLNSIAAEIVQKYATCEGDKLLPFITEQKYNSAIKEAFKCAEITRNVTILNPLTRNSEIRPLNEIASSHLARRTFCGNLYKKVKDPNLVGKLSGHKEGSKAFARYRDIDDDMKRELVTMIE